MYKMDQEAIEAAGYDRGMEVGIEQEKEDIAKKMIRQDIPIETIIECTELTKEEIEKLK